jgi:metal-responsive CopG/Arc/MetJ family transcriptional regulator
VGKKPDPIITVTFDAPESLVKKLEDEAREHGRCSRSAAIRLLLLRALAQNEKTA